MENYYSRRAPEYENIYLRDDHSWQSELAEFKKMLKESLRGRSVLEIACGTGYWTQIAAEVAHSIVAIDSSPEVLRIASSKDLSSRKIVFSLGNAYHLDSISGEFDAALANFWFSHVPKKHLNNFLGGLCERLPREAIILMADNVYVPGIGGQLVQHDGMTDTFKLRSLPDGSSYEVLKNYYSADELRLILDCYGSNLQIETGKRLWWARFYTQ